MNGDLQPTKFQMWASKHKFKMCLIAIVLGYAVGSLYSILGNAPIKTSLSWGTIYAVLLVVTELSFEA